MRGSVARPGKEAFTAGVLHPRLVVMTPAERHRAGVAVSERINDIGLTVAQVASSAGVDRKTLNALIAGRQWPQVAVRNKVETALGWEPGEILRRGRDGVTSLRNYSERDLLAELVWRFRQLDASNKGMINE